MTTPPSNGAAGSPAPLPPPPASPKVLTRDAILAARDIVPERLSLPEWGGDVFVRVMTGAERDSFECEGAALRVQFPTDPHAAGRNIRARLASRCLCDEKGAALFTLADVAALGLRNAMVLDKVWDVASRLNGIGQKEVAAAAGKSETSTPSGGRGSGSPSPTAAPSPSSSPS